MLRTMFTIYLHIKESETQTLQRPLWNKVNCTYVTTVVIKSTGITMFANKLNLIWMLRPTKQKFHNEILFANAIKVEEFRCKCTKF